MENILKILSSGWFYIAISVYLLLLSEAYAAFRYSRQVLQAVFLLMLLAVFSLAAANSHYGYDREVYLSFYNAVAIEGWSGGYQVELLFRLVLVLATALGLPFVLFMAAMSALSLLIKFRAASWFSINPFAFCFALYGFFFLDAFFVRQLLAASMVFMAVLGIERHNAMRWRWLFLLLAATLVHASAVIPGACYIGYRMRRRPVVLLAITLGAIAVAASFYEILLPKVLDQISVYSADGFSQVVDSSYSGLARNLSKNLILVAMACFCVYGVSPPSTTISKELGHTLFVLICMLSALSIVLSSFVSPVFQRLSLYVFPFVALLFASIYRRASVRTVIGARTIALMLIIYLLPILEGYPSLLL